MPQRLRRAALAVLVLLLSALIGCGPPAPKLAPVSGTVTYDGQPLPDGTVYFKSAQTGSFEALLVKGGKFEGNAEVGDRRVEITAYRTKSGNFNGMKGEVKESLIPDRYNIDSTLSATVTEKGPNAFTFEVRSK